jgi:hypothetical protein
MGNTKAKNNIQHEKHLIKRRNKLDSRNACKSSRLKFK